VGPCPAGSLVVGEFDGFGGAVGAEAGAEAEAEAEAEEAAEAEVAAVLSTIRPICGHVE